MTAATGLLPGFEDYVHDSQRIFRAAMKALAEPGTIRRLGRMPVSPAPLRPSMAALVLAMADHETSVWLDDSLAASPDVSSYIRFHCGAPITGDVARAAFVVVSEPGGLPALESMALGSLEYPDRSATVILRVGALCEGEGWTLSGPGIDGKRRLLAAEGPRELATTLARNRKLFPRGIDLLLAAGDCIAGLPRTTVVED